jgi:hypothetical protein
MYFYIFAILLALPFRVLCSQNITVNLGYSQYQGIAASDPLVLKWLGMRYAAPPVGDLRFRAPASPNATGGIQNANAVGLDFPPSPASLSWDLANCGSMVMYVFRRPLQASLGAPLRIVCSSMSTGHPIIQCCIQSSFSFKVRPIVSRPEATLLSNPFL